MADHDDELSPRQRANRQRRHAGEASAELARALMELPQAQLDRLGLEADVHSAVARARAVTAHGARKREERWLAGELRRIDFDGLAERVAALLGEDHAETRLFQRAEAWRARLIADEAALEAWLAEQPGIDPLRWQALIGDARREREVGKPRGAARALFREVMARLRGAG